MNERRASRSPYRVRAHAGSDLPTRHAVNAALMAAFFLVANGLALAWTLTDNNPYMRHGFVVAMIGIATALFPVVMWGLFRLPRLAVQTVVAATTMLTAAAIYGSGETQAPLSVLKIDRSFVAELDGDGRDAAIVSAIAEMARALGVRVVAEGVETETQLARVQELGCDLVQSYLFSKAVPTDQLTQLLRADPWRRVLTIHG